MSDEKPIRPPSPPFPEIIRAEVGSTIHGVGKPGAEDRDEMGICVEPADHVIGLEHFEQYIYRTAKERTGKQDAKSLPGDLDLTVYSLRKYLRLAVKGNPTGLLLLYVLSVRIFRVWLRRSPLVRPAASSWVSSRLRSSVSSRNGGRRTSRIGATEGRSTQPTCCAWGIRGSSS
jgi:hypothetical protein